MSIKIQTWAWKQPLKTGPKIALLALADESNDQGMVFLSREKLALKIAGLDESATFDEKENAARTLRRHVKVLMEENYIMTGRRQRKWSRGRAIDVIFLNVREVEGVTLYDSQDDVPGELPNPFLSNEPVDNSPNVLPDNLSGKRVSPSQDLGDNLSGKTSEPVLTGQNRTSYRTNRDVLPDNFVPEKTGALKGTRARLTLNNPLNPPPSSPPSPQEPPVDNPQMEEEEEKKTSKGFTRDPLLSELRSSLHRQKIHHTFTDTQLKAVMDMITSRYTDGGRAVKSPIGLTIFTIQNEPGGLDSLVKEATYRAQNPAPAPDVSPQRKWCDFHTREYTSAACPMCSNPRLANLPGERNSS